MHIRVISAAAAVLICLASVGNALAAKKVLSMDSLPVGTAAGQFQAVFKQIVEKYLPIRIKVTVGKAATKSAVHAAKKKVDLFLNAPTINHMMQRREAMYRLLRKAPELNKKLRSIISYPAGPYHIIVYEDSGIASLKDAKGKKVFLGPPTGAATKVAIQIMEAATGYAKGKDFEAVRYNWKDAAAAFAKRKMDVYFAPTNLPSPAVQKFADVAPIRIIGIPDSAWGEPALEDALSLPGRTKQVIPAGTYKNQVNEKDVPTIGSWVGLGTHMWLDEETVYQMTKALWEHLDELHAAAPWMKVIDKETALNEMNVPLHAGAYRYYKEAGFQIDDDLIPPEAE